MSSIADRMAAAGVTLTDPEGELCRLRDDSEFSDPYPHLVT
jgi:hypothetical protein